MSFVAGYLHPTEVTTGRPDVTTTQEPLAPPRQSARFGCAHGGAYTGVRLIRLRSRSTSAMRTSSCWPSSGR